MHLETVSDREIYLDHSATTKPFPEVIETMVYHMSHTYGNPSSLHKKGVEAERRIKEARERIATSLDTQAQQLYFTSGGTESNNIAIRGYLKANPRKGKRILTSSIEHPSVLEIYKDLEKNGYEVVYLPVDLDGKLNIEAFERAINEQTALISVMLVNNETGAIQPIDTLIQIKNRIHKEAVFHVDAVQAYGKLRIRPIASGIDLLTISAHKLHGPKGVGALYVGKNIRIHPIVSGGGQEAALRPGTENVAGICGFSKAVALVFEQIEASSKQVLHLKNRLIEGLEQNWVGIRIHSQEGATPYILNVSFPDIKAEVLLHHLEEKNIFVSTGSACTSRKQRNSHVLTAMGVKKCDIEGAIRFSFSTLNNEKDIDDTLWAIRDIIAKIRIKRGGIQ